MTDATATAAIERTLELGAPRARVWKAITDPTELVRWFPNRAEWDLRPGGTGVFFWDGYGDFPIQVVTVEEPEYLAWRWGNQTDVGMEPSDETTLVEWWLDERPDGGTTLRLRESGFTTAQHREGNSQGWDEELGELADLLG
jgi:uncharacterized protein YndB with AHSA1/START domain